jgi:hypothetical protein
MMVERLCRKSRRGVGNAGVNALDLGFRLLPVLAVPLLATQSLLSFQQPVFVFLEAVKRFDEFASRQRGETNNAHVDAYGRSRRMDWLLYLTPGQDRNEPFAVLAADDHALDCAKNFPAVAGTDPTQFRKKNAAVLLI